MSRPSGGRMTPEERLLRSSQATDPGTFGAVGRSLGIDWQADQRRVTSSRTIGSGGHASQAVELKRSKTSTREASITKRSTEKGRDIIESCEEGLVKSMRMLGQEILEDVREELRGAMSSLRQEVAASEAVAEGRESSMTLMLTQILGKVQNIHRDVERRQALGGMGIRDASLPPFDNAAEPMMFKKESRNNYDMMMGEVQRELLASMDGMLEQRLSKIVEEIHTVRRQQESAEQLLLQEIKEEVRKVNMGSDMEQIALRSQNAIETVFQLQQSMNAEASTTARNVHQIQILLDRSHSDLAPLLDALLTKYLRDQPINIDFTTPLQAIGSTRETVHADFVFLVAEIAKVQQALNVDFAQVLDGIGNMKEAAELKALPEVPATPTPTVRRKRLREMWCQTEKKGTASVVTQTHGDDFKEVKNVQKLGSSDAQNQKVPGVRQIFTDPETLKKQVRAAAMKAPLVVSDYYHEAGCAQRLARDPNFENVTLFVILLNAVWIAVDTDHNSSPMLAQADLKFQIAEHSFCTYFVFEIMVRFCAFKRKRDCLRDAWFVFDAILVSLMIMETWVFSIIVVAMGKAGGADMGNALLLRLVRIVRLLRISRMARLMRAIPELVILLKGIGAAARSLSVFCLLWLFIIYVFGILFRQTTEATSLGEAYFQSVPESMSTLLNYGILPEYGRFVQDVSSEIPMLWPIVMMFILVGGVTLMYMLIGVLVETMAAIALSEKESGIVRNLSMQLRDAIALAGRDPEAAMSRMEFQNIIVTHDIASILEAMGVNLAALVDSLDVMFSDEASSINFEEFVEALLNARGHNPCTVRDVTHLHRVIESVIQESSQFVVERLRSELNRIKLEIMEVRSLCMDSDPRIEAALRGGAAGGAAVEETEEDDAEALAEAMKSARMTARKSCE
eukprot:TRINITY_DN110867_c0_g1_i1.p1 TRINITY_DN110867_c0_g1~~TRINITY_DN110867_c0_g1_i1.p1  ORF type:complete len:907 (-),score=245.82 TRINITY_DN110867_c0_g1_i1:104-2824(-)